MSDLEQVAVDCEYHLTQIEKLFKNPKVTLIVRTPDNDEADFILTIDDIDEAIKALDRRKKNNHWEEAKNKR